MSESGHQPDPFGSTTGATEYVPRTASEEVLEAAEWALRSGRRCLVLTGPAGIGKTLVLRVLEKRLGADFRAVYAPYAALPPDELCAWVLGLLDEKSQGEPERELVDYARRCATRTHGLVVMIDDAASIPRATARRLTGLTAAAEGALRLVMVCADEEPAERVYPELGPVVEEIRLEEPMDLEETRHYVEQRLERARAPESVRARFDPDTVAALHRRSRGLPGVLHQLASEIVRGRDAEAIVGNLPTRRSAPLPGPWDEEEDDLSTSVPPEFLRRRTRARLQAAPQTRLLIAAAVVLALAAVLLPWLRPAPSPVRAPGDEPEMRAPQDPRTGLREPAPLAVPMEPGSPIVVAPPPPAPVETLRTSPAARPAGESALEPGPAEPGPATPRADAAPSALGVEFVAVNINATPWARIAVDGVYLGETPLANVPLLPGEHTITATLPSGQIQERTVVVDADNRHFGFGPGFGPDSERP